MPYTITWEDRGVYVDLLGDVSIDDILNADRDIYASENFDRMDYQIFDFRTISSFSCTAAEAETAAAMDAASSKWNNRRVKVASITSDYKVCTSALEYGKGLAGSLWVAEIFPDVESARKWINAYSN